MGLYGARIVLLQKIEFSGLLTLVEYSLNFPIGSSLVRFLHNYRRNLVSYGSYLQLTGDDQITESFAHALHRLCMHRVLQPTAVLLLLDVVVIGLIIIFTKLFYLFFHFLHSTI